MRVVAMKKFFHQVQDRVRQPSYLAALAVTTVSYFVGTRILQNFFYRGFLRPADLFESYGPKFLDPEPLEVPLYLLGYLVIPALALAVQAGLERWRPSVQNDRRWRWAAAVVAGATVLAMGVFFPWHRALSFLGQALAYVQTRGLGRALWLATTKRLFVSIMLAAVTAFTFVIAYVASRRWRFSLKPWAAIERTAARWGWIFVPLLAVLLFHPNFPYDSHHVHFFLAPVHDQLYGKPLLYETSSLYGIASHYLLVLIFGTRLLPFTYPAFSLLEMVFFFGFLTGLYFVLRSWFRSPTYAVAATLATTAVLFLFQTSPTRSAYDFPAMTPLRFWIFLPVLALLLSYGRTHRQCAARGAIALAVLSLAWNLETGLAIAVATWATLLITGPGKVFPRAVKLTGEFCAWGVGIFAVITLGNWAVYGSPPDWLSYLREIREYASGIAMYPLPAVGIFDALVIGAIAVVVPQVFRRSGETAETPLLFVAFYGAFAMVHYIGESTWQTLFLSAWPFAVLLFAVADRTAVHPAGRGRHVLTATLAAATFFCAGLFFVKLPVEFSYRNYRTVTESFLTVPDRDAALVRDAAILRRDFPEVRLPLLHINDAKLLQYAGKVNAFPVYYSWTLYYRTAMAQLVAQVEKERPQYVLVGNGSDAMDDFQRARAVDINAYFRPLLPSAYVITEQLETLDVYERRD
ncbi:MAG: hypothetical protein PHI63_06450 [Patescibacteria group bacterium]|nr:hypothetical protein [Patescibacteria group bacterium]